MKGFDRVASSYDFLARLVFGKSIVDAQEYFLSEIKNGDRVLILGGGTGWILNSVFKVANPSGIWYVDSSLKMIEKSKARITTSENIHFVQGSLESISENLKFDIVITNFFLDVFQDHELPDLIKGITARMEHDSLWLCSDFVDTGKFKHKVLLNMMYTFFIWCANLKNNTLPEWEKNLTGLLLIKEKLWWDGFIKSAVFKP